MKLETKYLKRIGIGLGAVAVLGVSGCVTNGDPLTGLSRLMDYPAYQNRSVARNDYVYYPDHDVYYSRASGEFMSVENDRWVTRRQPRNVSADRVLASRSVTIDEYGSPRQHRDNYYRRDVRDDRWNRASNASRDNYSSMRRVRY